MNKDSWLVFELPGFAKADAGKEQGSIDALRAANETSYFKSEDALWVKLVVPADPEPPVRPTLMQTSVTVSR
jgi:cell migration-inducing and hyaluronan-binding protein